LGCVFEIRSAVRLLVAALVCVAGVAHPGAPAVWSIRLTATELTSRIEVDLGGIGAPTVEAAAAAVLRHFVLRADGRSLASEVTARRQRDGGQLEFELRHALPDTGVLDIESTFFELAGIEHYTVVRLEHDGRIDTFTLGIEQPSRRVDRRLLSANWLLFGAAVLAMAAVAVILKRTAQALAVARAERRAAGQRR
jgi:hypothetical protein